MTAVVFGVAVRNLVLEREGHDWCLFLDRDGVINQRIAGDYVRRWQDFKWLPLARQALERLRDWAPHMVVVTNQQGIGKGLMTGDDVRLIHRNLSEELSQLGVAIDDIQVCPHLETDNCKCRKPKPGLVLDWLENHPHIKASLSVVVGDTQSDLGLAQHIAGETGGCAFVSIGGSSHQAAAADASFASLWDFAIAVAYARQIEGA